MTSPAVFIGVVSYRGSKFAISQGPSGLASRLKAAFAAHNVTSSVAVNVENLFDPESLTIDEACVQASLSVQIDLDQQWSKFLRQPFTLRRFVARALRVAKRQQQRLGSPGVQMVQRLINIELSHLDLMRKGLDTGAAWVLILEDDAATLDLEDCTMGLTGLLTHGDRLAYANVSQSFSSDELGITHLLTPLTEVSWQGSAERLIYRSSLPATNTVCAILYERNFLSALVAELDEIPVEPVVPIDWKLNLALMNLDRQGVFASQECWFVDPGPIDQLSMRS